MKINAFIPVVFMLCAAHLQANEPIRKNVAITKIYAIQHGFDDNDSVDIAAYGLLSDTCHKIDRNSFKVDHRKKIITVSITSVVRPQDICLEILTPFLEVIPVGILNAGIYEVRASNSPTVSSQLEVKPRTSDNRDDYLYAPVDTVEVERVQQIAGHSHDYLVLKGTYPYMLRGCMRVEEVKISTINKEILVVQPIVKIMEDINCNPQDVGPYNRFTTSVEIANSIGDHGLVHVRTLNGKALNKYIDFSQP